VGIGCCGTDFLISAEDLGTTSLDLRYFEGEPGNDTATAMRSKGRGYLLLTNGID